MQLRSIVKPLFLLSFQNHQWKQDLKHQELRVATIAALSQQIKGRKIFSFYVFDIAKLEISLQIWHVKKIKIVDTGLGRILQG